MLWFKLKHVCERDPPADITNTKGVSQKYTDHQLFLNNVCLQVDCNDYCLHSQPIFLNGVKNCIIDESSDMSRML